MAYEIPGMVHTFKAAGDLSTYQFHFMKLTADDTVSVCTGQTDIPCGVLQNKPNAAGKTADVMLYGITKLEVDAAGSLTFGLAVGTAASGEAESELVTDGTHYNCGRVLEGAADAELCTAMINCINPMRNS